VRKRIYQYYKTADAVPSWNEVRPNVLAFIVEYEQLTVHLTGNFQDWGSASLKRSGCRT
jgi:hypothetical protein